MKSTGILFSTPMVIADLNGTKTMTRRTWGLNSVNIFPDDWELVAVFQDGIARFHNKKIDEERTVKCPYGGIEDEIYLKETWAISSFSPNFAKWQQLQVAYKAGVFALDRDMAHDLEWRTVDYETWKKYAQPKYYSWHSSMFMPKWASRRKHILTNLRCERVQDITEEDAVAEGLQPYRSHQVFGVIPQMDDHRFTESARMQYKELWDALNGKRGYPFSKNCFVWILEWEK
jgi:hypothetical protein